MSQLDPIRWNVWQIANPDKKGTVTAETRAEAIRRAAKHWRLADTAVDAEAVR